ncbi:transcription mediator complex subunit Med12-domain-containing protein, partial [Lineolata rhizophorae]
EPIDFYPWQGNGMHPEDITSDATIKGGIGEKSNPHQDMTGTARPSLWQHLKNKPGLTVLGHFFVTVLERRRAAGRLTAPPTFRPPPRSAFNETKREGWLKDLANPAVPLRRMSRTIPHGIHGKRLLEQCAAKQVPPARAIWLIKSVGTNEIRAFKRSRPLSTAGAPGGSSASSASTAGGLTGELKYFREFTIGLEQFVEATIADCGTPGWKQRMDYAVRLSSHMYAAQLLEQDHYFDWLLGSLEASPTDRLPIWLLLIQVYWRDLVATRRRGRRLAEAVLAQLTSARAESGADADAGGDDGGPLQPLIDRLQRLVALLATRHRACLIMPRVWYKYASELERLPGAVRAAVRSIVRRNERLAPPTKATATTRGPRDVGGSAAAPRKEVLALLDAAASARDVPIDKLAERCVAVLGGDGDGDVRELVTVTMQWATTIFRDGEHRIYLAARLVRKWRKMGLDTDEGVLGFMAGMGNKGEGGMGVGIAWREVFRLVGELVRANGFGVGRYLARVIATG